MISLSTTVSGEPGPGQRKRKFAKAAKDAGVVMA